MFSEDFLILVYCPKGMFGTKGEGGRGEKSRERKFMECPKF